MSIDSYNLRLKASYDFGLVAFQMARFRALLRKEREARVGGREKLSKRADVNKTTIQNIETGPDIPGIDTVAKLIEAMPDITLSGFFRQLEDGPKPATLSPATADHASEGPLVERPTAADIAELQRLGRAFYAAAEQAASASRAARRPRKKSSGAR